jgi:hypothetical protein
MTCYHERTYQWEPNEPVYCQDCGAQWASWADLAAELQTRWDDNAAALARYHAQGVF